MDTDSPRMPTVALFLLVTVLFGAAFPAIEVGLAFLPPLLFAAARYYISATVLLAYAFLATDRWRPRTRGDRRAVAAGGVLFIGGTGFTFLGQQFTTGGVAAIIVSLSPIITALLGWVLLPEERFPPADSSASSWDSWAWLSSSIQPPRACSTGRRLVGS